MLNRWSGGLLLLGMLTLGCGAPTPPPHAAAAPQREASHEPLYTPTPPVLSETPTVAVTPVAMKMPEPMPIEEPAPAATPTGGGAAGGVETKAPPEQLADYESADGLAGYEEVLAMAVPEFGAADVDAGKTLYATNCASCHGATGKGDGDAGKALNPPPRDLTSASSYLYGQKELAMFRTIKYGIEGSGMVGWDGRMSEDEMWKVAHYVTTIQQ